MPAASAEELRSVDAAALDAFRAELVKAGFEPVGAGPRMWEGPIHEALGPLTGAETMTIYIYDGWPYRPPGLFAEGIEAEHIADDGTICLFQPGEQAIGEWSTFAALSERIALWAERAVSGFLPEDELLDAHLYFSERAEGIVTLALDELGSAPAAHGELYGVRGGGGALEISTRREPGLRMRGHWYYSSTISVPPRDLEGFRAALSAGQASNFERRLRSAASGSELALALLWKTPAQRRNALVVLAGPGEDGPSLRALELAPTDAGPLLLRAGPDAGLLAGKRVCLFGAGAIGSQLGSLLARAGLGYLRLVEADVLRPGNRVRHGGDPAMIGANKAASLAAPLAEVAPWCEVEVLEEEPWGPGRLSELISDCDLAIDATGLLTFAEMLGVIALKSETTLLSAALFRGGAVARVRRQDPDRDTPLVERVESEAFPLIPAGEEPEGLEVGCVARVNNASPVAAARVAADAAETAIDALTERYLHPEEQVDVYRPLDEAPFDRIGRLRG